MIGNVFNSFFESLRPIELGKSKVLSLLGGYSLYIVSFLGMLGASITYMILTGGQIYQYIFLIFFLLFLTYSVLNSLVIAGKVLYPSYESKTYKVTYSNMQMLKKGFLFQASFTAITLFYQLIFGASSDSGVTYTIAKIIMLTTMSLFLIVSTIIYWSYSSILKPLQQEIREQFMKHQQNLRNNMSQSRVNSGTRGWGSQNSPFANDNVGDFDISKKEPKISPEQEEDIARSANVPVIDISDDLEDRKISPAKRDDDSKKDTNDDDDDSGDKKITAF